MKNITIFSPLEGEWQFLRPPGHHPFAFDFVQLDERRASSHRAYRWQFMISSIPANQFFCWGKPVYAPVSGKVIQVCDGVEDHPASNIWKTIQLWYIATFKFRPQVKNGRLDISPNAGNHVMIEANDGFIVFLAHFQNQSIVVTEGAIINRGDRIGNVGNSGNSTMPHLHINLFDQMKDPYSAKVLPFVFHHYELLNNNRHWDEQRLSLPTPGDIVKFHG